MAFRNLIPKLTFWNHGFPKPDSETHALEPNGFPKPDSETHVLEPNGFPKPDSERTQGFVIEFDT